MEWNARNKYIIVPTNYDVIRTFIYLKTNLRHEYTNEINI